MVSENEKAPIFNSIKIENGDIEEFSLEESIGDGPVVLAFFPAAFTSGCTNEMCEFRDSLSEFKDLNAKVYGISVDAPFSLSEFAEKNDLDFPLLSDQNKEVIEKYDVVMGKDVLGDIVGAPVGPVSKRSVFVIDNNGEITYKWVSDDPTVLPEIEEVKEAVKKA